MKTAFKFILLISTIGFCACSKHIPSAYEVVSMSLTNSDNRGEKPTDAITDSVPRQAYAIKMILNEEMRDKKGGDAQENGFINEDRLSSMNIFSLNNFDASYPAGSSLNSYFLTELNSSSTLDAFISKGQIGGGKYVDGNYTDSWSTDQYLYLMRPPASIGTQSFVVEIGFSDGRNMKDTINVKLY